MKQKVIAERYAEALFDVARELRKEASFGLTLREISELVSQNPELEKFLQHPVIQAGDKHAVLKKLFREVPKEILHFLLLLVDKKRENYLSDISREYQRLVHEMQRKIVTEVVTAVPLTVKNKNLLKKELEAYLEQSVEMNCETDASILGGVRIKIGDRMIDGSLKTKLAGLAQSLI
jgi:F-type H+-transporting ATPase subunit delta